MQIYEDRDTQFYHYIYIGSNILYLYENSYEDIYYRSTNKTININLLYKMTVHNLLYIEYKEEICYEYIAYKCV